MNKKNICILFFYLSVLCACKDSNKILIKNLETIADTIEPLKFIFFHPKTLEAVDSISSTDIRSYELNQEIAQFRVHRMMLKDSKVKQLQKKVYRDTLILNCYSKGKLLFTSKHYNMKFPDFADTKNIKFFFNAECQGESYDNFLVAEDYFNPRPDMAQKDSFSIKKEVVCLGVSFLYKSLSYHRQYTKDTLNWESEKLKSTEYIQLLKGLKLLKK